MKLLVVGEFLSNKDAEEGGPFTDGLGKMYRAMLRDSGIHPSECLFTNVILKTSPTNGLAGLCGNKDQGIPNIKSVMRGKYLKAEYKSDLELLWRKVNEFKPNLVLACGDLALWALTSEVNIETSRGRITHGHAAIPDQKVLPIYSARQMIIDYTQRPIILADLQKARRQMEFPEIRRPRRFMHIQPTLEDIENFYEEYIVSCETLDVDIETKGTIITCVGFAPNPERALVIPFYDELRPNGNYWRSQHDEYLAWQAVKRFLRVGQRVGGQNFQYDMQYLWETVGIKCPTMTDDTMLLHHVLQPEMRKGLGFLASIYTDELSWKAMHKLRADDKTGKQGDD